MYRIYILLGCESSLAKICFAMCECTASFVSLLPFTPHFFLSFAFPLFIFAGLFTRNQLAALVFLLFPCFLYPCSGCLQNMPNHSPANIDKIYNDSVPTTSLPFQWRASKTREKSTLPMLKSTFKNARLCQTYEPKNKTTGKLL